MLLRLQFGSVVGENVVVADVSCLLADDLSCFARTFDFDVTGRECSGVEWKIAQWVGGDSGKWLVKILEERKIHEKDLSSSHVMALFPVFISSVNVPRGSVH